MEDGEDGRVGEARTRTNGPMLFHLTWRVIAFLCCFVGGRGGHPRGIHGLGHRRQADEQHHLRQDEAPPRPGQHVLPLHVQHVARETGQERDIGRLPVSGVEWSRINANWRVGERWKVGSLFHNFMLKNVRVEC